MRDALAWSAARSGLYLGYLLTCVLAASLFYNGHAFGQPGDLLPLAGAAPPLTIYSLLVFVACSPARRRISNIAMKFLLLPFFLFLAPRRPIPLESTLVQQYGIARETARKAVRMLAVEGLVFTVQGRGTYATG